MITKNNKPHGSIWEETASRTAANRLQGDIFSEVVVIGGGLTGLSAALELAKRGKQVCRDRGGKYRVWRLGS